MLFFRSIGSIISLIAVVFFTTGLLTSVQAQSKFQLWTDFNPTYKLDKKWTLGGDLGYRIEPESGKQTVYVRPTVIYKLNPVFKLSAGVANYNIWDSDHYKSFEFRSFLFTHVSWPKLGEFVFSHRLGIEQRWFMIQPDDISISDQRIRYYLQLKSPNFNLFNLKQPFYGLINYELLRDISKAEILKLFNQNRITLALGSEVTERLKIDARLKIMSFVNPLNNNFVRDLDVLRIRIFYKIKSS